MAGSARDEGRPESGGADVEEADPGRQFFLFKYLDLSLCKDPLFWIVAGTVMCMSVGFPHVMFFLPNYIR